MKVCSKCQQENSIQAKFCIQCGTRLNNPAGIDSLGEGDQAERRQLTLFFCDLVDSTPLSERMDPEDYRQMILDYHNVAEAVVNRYGGKVGNYIGDGLLVYFGYPEGLENSAITGVQTARAVIAALDEVRRRWEDPEKKIYVNIRVGIHTGLVIVDDHLALGETVNLAARLEGLAPHNGIVVSPQTLNLIKGWFEVKSIGMKSLKGISEPMEVFEVIGETGARTRLDISKFKGLSPLVGRAEEIKRLREHWARAQDGKGSALMLLGEAGIGKSRLSDKLEAEVNLDGNSIVLEARSSMYSTNSAFYPLLEVIENDLLGIKTSDESQQRLEKLERFFKERESRQEELISLFAEYLGISSEAYPPLAVSPFAKRAKIMAAISGVFLKLSKENPLLLVIEDLHWADASTFEWLESFKEKIQDKTLFLLCTTRPHPKGDPKRLPEIELVKLVRLQADNMKHICLHQAHGKQLPEVVLDQIIEKTEGVPLFVEELTKMVLKSDRLEEKKDHYELIGPMATLDIPSTLQDSLLARLDQLKDVKDIVQMGSVIGREFSMDMLKAVLPEKDEELTQNIKKLLNAEILQNSDKDEEPGFQFKHALIQDTAYGSMLRSRRRHMHKKVATVLQEDFSEICETQPEQLAHHLTEADQPAEAIPQWLRAAQGAAKTNAAKEAIAHLQKGLELLPGIEDEIQRRNFELDLIMSLGGLYIISHGFPHPLVKETFDQAKDLAQNMEVSPKLALILIGILNYYFNTEDYQAFDQLSEHMESLSKDPQHGYWFKLYLSHFKGGILCRGDIKHHLPNFRKTLELFNPELPFRWELTPSGYLPYATKGWWMVGLQIGGYPAQAKKLSIEQLTYKDKEYQDSTSLYHVYTFPALYGLFAREWSYAQEILEQYLPLTRSFGDPVFTLTAEVYYYISKFFQGERDSFDQTIQLVNVCFDIGFKAFAVTMSGFIAQGYQIYGDFEASLKWIDRILAHVKVTKTHIQTSELNRLKGRALEALGASDDEIERQFRKARNLSRKQGAKTFEIRAAMDLARLWHRQGHTKKAHNLLKESYDWFSEGFDSVDLKEARGLMQELEKP